MANAEIIKEFLVSLGFKVDNQGLKGFTGSIEDATRLVEGLTVKLAEIGAAVAGATMVFANSMENVYFSAKRTGTQADSLRAFGEAARNFGVDVGEASANVETFAAKLRNQPGFEGWLQSLGVTTRANGVLRDTSALMVDMGKALQRYEPYQRRLFADQAGLSERMLLALSDPRFADEVSRKAGIYKNSGLQKAAEDAHQFEVKLRELSDTIKANLAPTMTWLVNVFQNGLEGADGWFKKHAAEINQWKDALGAGLKSVLGDIDGMIKTLSGALTFYIDKIVEYSEKAYRAIYKIIPDFLKGEAGQKTMASFGEKFGWMGSGLSFGDEEFDALKSKGGAAGSVSEKKKGTTEYVMGKLMSMGWTKEQAAGITANLLRESSLDPGAVGDGGKAYGVGQWHTDRQSAFKRWSGKDIRDSTLDEQIAFVNHELTVGDDAGARRAGALMQAQRNNAYASADIFSRHYERPADKEGEAAARGSAAVQISQTNNITVSGVENASEVRREVTRGLDQSNADMTRNMQTAVK